MRSARGRLNPEAGIDKDEPLRKQLGKMASARDWGAAHIHGCTLPSQSYNVAKHCWPIGKTFDTECPTTACNEVRLGG